METLFDAGLVALDSISLGKDYYYYYYYYYCELYSHMTVNNVSDGNEKSDESSEQG